MSAPTCPPDSSSLPPHECTKLDYTPQDWRRWDTFEQEKYGVVKRREYNPESMNQNQNQNDTSSLSVSSLSLTTPSTTTITSPSLAYHTLFQHHTLTSFYAETYLRRFRYLQLERGGKDDFIAFLQKEKQLLHDPILQRAEFTLNQEYNHWREKLRQQTRQEIMAAAAKQTNGAQLDVVALDAQVDMIVDSTPFHARTHPQCRVIIEWLTELISVHLSQQCLDPNSTTDKGNGQSYKNYGMWQEKDGSNPLYNQDAIFWKSPGIGFLYGHYLHLLDDSLIRSIRKATYASLSAQWAYLQRSGRNVQHHSDAQYLLRVAGWIQALFVILRSEAELRKRGVWNEGSDTIKATNQETGEWTTPDLITFVNEYAGEYYTRFSLSGSTEFLSSYHGYTQDLVIDVILHAPSQQIYDGFSRHVMDRMTWDLIANFLPQTGTFPGPSSRSYDLFAGAHNTQDRLDNYLYLKWMLPPFVGGVDYNNNNATTNEKSLVLAGSASAQNNDRKQVQLKTHSNGMCMKKEVGMMAVLEQMCCENSGNGGSGGGGNNMALMKSSGGSNPSTALRYLHCLPSTGNQDQNMHRLMYAIQQMGNMEPLPYRYIRDIILQAPCRIIEQRFSLIRGQERSNFITPFYQLGHAGEDIASVPLGCFACARLAGLPVQGKPTAKVPHGETNCTSMIRLFPQIGQRDDPFHRNYELDVAGNNELALSRQVATQYQGWMLTTSFLAPKWEMKDEELEGSWNTNLVLPINTDAIYADDVKLPTEVGTLYRIPPGAIITVRHQGASVCLRLVTFTYDDHIPHAQRVEPSQTPPVPGVQPCSVTWQVDASSVLAGCGRIVVHHRHNTKAAQAAGIAALPPRKPYRVAFLWGAGRSADDAEMKSLASVLRAARIQESLKPSEKWQENNQPHNRYPDGYPQYCTEVVGEMEWKLDVLVGGGNANAAAPLKLSVHRTDVYLPYQHLDIYREPQKGPLFRVPYHFKSVRRMVNDQETLQFADKEDPYRYAKYELEGQLFEPHRQGGNVQVFAQQPMTHFAPLA